jgi:hypothetical protein
LLPKASTSGMFIVVFEKRKKERKKNLSRGSDTKFESNIKKSLLFLLFLNEEYMQIYIVLDQ